MRYRLVRRSLGLFLAAVLAGYAVADEEDAELKTIEDRLLEHGDTVQARLQPDFAAAGVSFPPARLTFLILKDERVFELWAANAESDFKFICSYPILGASGALGPKLREGDLQVPEGIYCLRELNPNSRFHVSLWIDYPSAFDRARALEEGRVDPGGEIMIHGGTGSRGCVAIGDEAAEDLFVLAALTGVDNVRVVLAPVDFRQRSLDQMPDGAPEWLGGVYDDIKAALATLTFPTTR